MTDTKTINAKAFLKRAEKSFSSGGPISTPSLGIVKCLVGMMPDESLCPDWIPCSDVMPEDGESVLVTQERFDGLRRTVAGNYNAFTGLFYGDNGTIMNVIAWQPLPEPYNPNHVDGISQDTIDESRDDYGVQEGRG